MSEAITYLVFLISALAAWAVVWQAMRDDHPVARIAVTTLSGLWFASLITSAVMLVIL